MIERTSDAFFDPYSVGIDVWDCQVDWSIDLESGHCKHPNGLSVYVDIGNDSGIVRCLGPFGSQVLSESTVRESSRALTAELEADNILRDRKLLVWGAYTHSALYFEHKFPILGSSCGFVPNLLYREQLTLGSEVFDQEGRWTQVDARLVHASGMEVDHCLNLVDASRVDPRLLCPNTAAVILLELAKMGLKRFTGHCSEKLDLEMPSLSWTSTVPKLALVS